MAQPSRILIARSRLIVKLKITLTRPIISGTGTLLILLISLKRARKEGRAKLKIIDSLQKSIRRCLLQVKISYSLQQLRVVAKFQVMPANHSFNHSWLTRYNSTLSLWWKNAWTINSTYSSKKTKTSSCKRRSTPLSEYILLIMKYIY